MRHGRFGYILLALLVLTGLAGTLSDSTLSRKERLAAIEVLRATTAREQELRETVASASNEKDLYQKAQEKLELVRQYEEACWQELREEMKKPVSTAMLRVNRLLDHEIPAAVANVKPSLQYRSFSGSTYNKANSNVLSPTKTNLRWIRYVRNSTEDLRHHVLKTEIGNLDGYQYILYVNARKAVYLERIAAELSGTRFIQ